MPNYILSIIIIHIIILLLLYYMYYPLGYFLESYYHIIILYSHIPH